MLMLASSVDITFARFRQFYTVVFLAVFFHEEYLLCIVYTLRFSVSIGVRSSRTLRCSYPSKKMHKE